MRDKNLISKNRANIEEMINHFRAWELAWKEFDKQRESKHTNPIMPRDVITFGKELSRLYKVKKK